MKPNASTSVETRDDNANDVLFYILNSTDSASREAFVCKLINKIYQQGRHCDVRFADQQEAQRFELTLWNWKAESFIPHAIQRQVPAPVQLYSGQIDKPCADVLINLHPDFSEQYNDYQRTIEIVDQSEFLVQKGRQRYKDYGARNLQPTVHKIGFE
jgi:DNA polymerase-3 subunit chi